MIPVIEYQVAAIMVQKKMVAILQSGNVLSPKYDFSCWQSDAFIEMGRSCYD